MSEIAKRVLEREGRKHTLVSHAMEITRSRNLREQVVELNAELEEVKAKNDCLEAAVIKLKAEANDMADQLMILCSTASQYNLDD